MDYAHPEVAVTSTSSTAFGRNYFSRPSTVEQENMEEAEERAQVLADASALKKLAVNHAHPEFGVKTTESASFGRNYFSRPSAAEQDDKEEAEERVQVLADAVALKELAVAYYHPEVAVTSTSSTAFGRNYFSRSSAVEEEDKEEAEERVQVLADAVALKKLAVDYAHPEFGVTTIDSTAFGRNYFSRPSVVVPSEDSCDKNPADNVSDIGNVSKGMKIAGNDKLVKSKLSGIGKDVTSRDNSDEGHVKRSPSSVVLFGLGEDSSAY